MSLASDTPAQPKPAHGEKPRFQWDDPLLLDDALSEDERMVRDTARAYCQDKLMPRVLEANRHERFDREIMNELGALGLLGPTLPAEYGGAGVSHVCYGLIAREVERVDSGYRSALSVQSSLVMWPIFAYGSEEQRRKYLPKLATGEWVGAFGLTEPDAGSDPGRMKTRARRDGDDWVLDGEKLWITNSPAADVAVVWARTGDDKDTIRGFLLERGLPGFSAPHIPRKMSMRASLTGGLVMQSVRVPNDALLPGSSGLGSPLSCLNNARFSVAFGVMGAARYCLQRALDYTGERTQFGAPVASKQLVQTQLADMAQQVVTGELLSLHVGRLKDQGRLSPYQVSLAKRNNCAAALAVARQCRGLLGANGITVDYGVIRHALNLESTYTYEGTHEIHALILGRGLTGFDAF